MFGKFVNMNIVINNPLVHHILLREVQKNIVDAMSFELNEKIVVFSKEEFLLVMGLWWSPTKRVHSVDVTEALRTKYFNNLMATEVHLTKFEERFKELVFENDLYTVKVSLVYYYELGLIRKDKTKTSIDKSLLDDEEDLGYFNSLDWDIFYEREPLMAFKRH